MSVRPGQDGRRHRHQRLVMRWRRHAASKLHARLLRGQQTEPLLQRDAVLGERQSLDSENAVEQGMKG